MLQQTLSVEFLSVRPGNRSLTHVVSIKLLKIARNISIFTFSASTTLLILIHTKDKCVGGGEQSKEVTYFNNLC